MWKIFYSDGSTFSFKQGTPEQAPSEGFVCAVGYDQEGKRYIMHGWDFYCYDLESRQWWGCDRMGLHDRLRRNVMYAYKEGRTVTNKVYQELMERAHSDPEYPIG